MITLLYASLLGLLQVTLAYKVGSSRLKTNTLLGDGNQSEFLQKVRAHGNLTCLLYTSPSPRDDR